MNIHDVYGVFHRHFRKSRNARFLATFNVTEKTRILDVGGTSSFWNSIPVRPQVTLLNIRADEDNSLPQVEASALDLPFADKSFDIVFSNSLIEHLHSEENQIQAAKEMLRVGQEIWVQTPYRWFPIEPHFLTPLIHWFPHRYRRYMLRFTVWAFITKATPEFCDEMWNEVRLLSIRDMKMLFPGCQIVYERFGGIVKSIVAVRSISKKEPTSP